MHPNAYSRLQLTVYDARCRQAVKDDDDDADVEAERRGKSVTTHAMCRNRSIQPMANGAYR